jgi:D-tagatose-1,6-bisphosphate aldolase subunit GatZ/KbaZ
MTAPSFPSVLTPDRGGSIRGLYSVCSSHSLVLESAVRHAALTGCPVLIEATANQVNQYGGYTGMKADDFARGLDALCKLAGADPALVIFGGDHLGPFPWRHMPADEAMGRAETLVRSFVRAGARKIHLDASMALGDDHGPALAPRTATERSARLCAAAEDEWRRILAERPGAKAPVYVIGTEVPIPGGVQGTEKGPVPTRPEDFRTEVELHREVFASKGLAQAWERVIAVVVQPGVEFDSVTVFPYLRERSLTLIHALEEYPSLVFEAHSTDYQSDSALAALVDDKFSILKVGPGLTFVLREALFGLCHIVRELDACVGEDDLILALTRSMETNDTYWKGYYLEGPSLPTALLYGLSDRVRYYWNRPEVVRALRKLFERLEGRQLPLGLLAQFLPRSGAVHDLAGSPVKSPHDLVLSAIYSELDRYHAACFCDGSL